MWATGARCTWCRCTSDGHGGGTARREGTTRDLTRRGHVVYANRHIYGASRGYSAMHFDGGMDGGGGNHGGTGSCEVGRVAPIVCDTKARATVPRGVESHGVMRGMAVDDFETMADVVIHVRFGWIADSHDGRARGAGDGPICTLEDGCCRADCIWAREMRFHSSNNGWVWVVDLVATVGVVAVTRCQVQRA